MFTVPYPDEPLLEQLKDTRIMDANIPEHEFLQFRRLQCLIYNLRLAGYDIEAMHTEVFMSATFYGYVNCKVAVTRSELDFEINDAVLQQLAGKLSPDLVWLTTNANVDHPRIQALPIGITNYCGYHPYHAVIGDTQKFKNLIDAQMRTQRSLVLMNFLDRTNFAVRNEVRSLFKGKRFVTEIAYGANEIGYAQYVDGLRSHPFCLAPRGNGIDTHRIWEALYAGCIPIVQKTQALRSFEDLPILFVDRWEDACDENMLIGIRDEYHRRTWDLRKLTLSHWYRTVLELLTTRDAQKAGPALPASFGEGSGQGLRPRPT